MAEVKVKRFVNYQDLTLFASYLAHEYKKLGYDRFVEKYKKVKYRGIKRKYLKAYLSYLENQHNHIKVEDKEDIITSSLNKKLIVEPSAYQFYFKYRNKDIVNKQLSNAILEFLKEGFLFTKVQEAVYASSEQSLLKA